MDSRRFGQRPPPFGGGGMGFGLSGPVPPDLWALLGVIFVTFSLQFFRGVALIPALLRLTPSVWGSGFLWQLVTYPFAGTGPPSLWFLLELLILFLFGRQVFERLGRRGFWSLLVSAAGVAAAVAVTTQLLALVAAGPPPANAFSLMQGQHMALVILIAAFATLFRDATIYLFFVLPVQARWFLWLEILFAFIGFLGGKDLAGFVGVCAAVGFTYLRLVRGGGRRGLRESWLRLQALYMRARLAWLRRRRGFKVVRGDRDRGPGGWVN